MTDRKTSRKALAQVIALEGDSLESNIPTVLITTYTGCEFDRKSIRRFCESLQQTNLPWLIQERSNDTLKVVRELYRHDYEDGRTKLKPVKGRHRDWW